jgi:hypothetical protein
MIAGIVTLYFVNIMCVLYTSHNPHPKDMRLLTI